MPFPFFMLNSILFRAPIFSLFHPVFSIVFSPSLPFLYIYLKGGKEKKEGSRHRPFIMSSHSIHSSLVHATVAMFIYF